MPRTRYFDLTGERFGQLLVKERFPNTKKGPVIWSCICDCGNKSFVATANLRNGTTKSCGCFRKKYVSDKHKTHGMAKTSTYRVWSGMKTRCLNPKSTNYTLYGGRGVLICDRWMLFENFLEDMGNRPDSMTLDRIDVNGNYEPSNCRWATKKEQGENKRKCKLINQDSLLGFLKTQSYLTKEQQTMIAEQFFKDHR